ncbi:hypothetical protein ABW19_dt0210028 [Dactylella cylindrospora]|nr:hypothetical protein ABW19_dt0210028 [Dactylella cylindrospora]
MRISLKPPSFASYFPFPGTAAYEIARKFNPFNNNRERFANDFCTRLSSCEGKLSPIELLAHAERVISGHAAVMFFADVFHQHERHDKVHTHNCLTEQSRNPLCNETVRVLVFLAQNQVYNLQRCVRPFAFSQRVITECSLTIFEEVEMPLPENWWIEEDTNKKQYAPFGHCAKLTDKEIVKIREEESFQERRLSICRFLANRIHTTPARKLDEYERQHLWYNKGIVAGLVFLQIIPLTWCFDSILAKDCTPEDLELCGYDYLQPLSLDRWKEAIRITGFLNIKC